MNVSDTNSTRCANLSALGDNSSCAGDGLKFFYEYREYEIFRLISQYSYLVVNVPAVPLNLLCVAGVLGMRPFNSSCVYMLALGITDLLCAVTGLVYQHAEKNKSQFVCKLVTYSVMHAPVYSNFILVCFTLERLFVTSFPLKAEQTCTKQKAAAALAVSFVLCSGLNVIYFTDSRLQEDVRHGTGAMICRVTPFATNTWVKVFSWYRNFIPLVVIALSNIVIMRNLRKTRRRKRRLTGGRSASKKANSTRTLVTVSMVFITLHLPYVVFSMAAPDYPDEASLVTFDQQMVARLFLMGTTVYSIMSLQNGVNFFLYCLTSVKFRDGLGASFRRICRCCAPDPERRRSIWST